MPRRAAHPENPRQQALRAKRGGDWLAKDLFTTDDFDDYQFNEDGLYVGNYRTESSPDNELVNRFLTAALLVGALLRLIGLIQYTGFTRVPALGFPIHACLSLATIENGHRNLAFEMIEKLVSLHEYDPRTGEPDPVAFLREFISEMKHLPSCTSEEVRNTEADVSTSDFADTFELVTPSIFERTEQPIDPRFEQALDTARMVQQLISVQLYDECQAEKIKIGHFPYYKKKDSTEVDYDLVELSAVKLVLQGYANACYDGEEICPSCKVGRTWFTPFRPDMHKICGITADNPDSAVADLAYSVFTLDEIQNPIPRSGPDKAVGTGWVWTPPWLTGSHLRKEGAPPGILEILGDTTFSGDRWTQVQKDPEKVGEVDTW